MIKQSHKTYWFKRRRYGYGWTPVTVRGWAVLATFIAVVLALAPLIENEQSSGVRWIYLNLVFSALLFLIGISLAKGPLPKWRWGKSESDDPAEDI